LIVPLIVKRPWSKQPTIAVGIDRDNPITRGLQIALNPGAGKHAVDLALGRPVTYASNISIVRNGNLPASGSTRILLSAPSTSFLIPAASSGIEVPSWQNNTNAASLLILQKAPLGSNEWMKTSNASDTDHFPYGSSVYTSAFMGSRWVNGFTPSVGTAINDPVAIGISVRNGLQNFYWNASLAVNAALSTFSLSPVLRFGSFTGSTQIGFNGHMFLILVWSRFLSEAEFRSLSLNPWQVFAPLNSVLPAVSVAPSLPTFSAPTYAPGSLTSSGWTPQVTAT
jgi:hypothetical protein